MPSELTQFEKDLNIAEWDIGRTKVGSGADPATSNSDRYALRIRDVPSFGIIDLTSEDMKYALGIVNVPGHVCIVNIKQTGWANYRNSDDTGWDPTGGCITADGNLGTIWVRNLFSDGEQIQAPGSYRGKGANKDVLSFNQPKDRPNVHVNGFNWEGMNLKDGIDSKVGGKIDKLIMSNCYRLERVWNSAQVERTNAHYYLGNGSHFIWMGGTSSEFKHWNCKWTLGTRSNPGQTWDNPANIPAQYLSFSDGATRAQIKAMSRPSWLDQPYWTQARAMGNGTQPPIDPPIDPPIEPPIDPPSGSLEEQVALNTAAIKANSDAIQANTERTDQLSELGRRHEIDIDKIQEYLRPFEG